MNIQPSASLFDLTTNTTSSQEEKYRTPLKLSESDEANQDKILKQSLQTLIDLNSNYNSYCEAFKIKDGLSAELLSDLDNIFKIRREDPKAEYLRLISDIFEQIAILWSKAIHNDNLELNAIATELFNFEDKDKLVFEEKNLSSDEPLLVELPNQEHKTWIASLNKGDKVDCVKMDPQTKWMCWSHATIIDISDDTIVVSFLREDEKSSTKNLSKLVDAGRLAPFNSKCTDFEWRMNLKQGDTIDVCDTVNVWYNSIVVNVKYVKNANDGQEEKLVLIGYRVYNENGKAFDITGKKYSGWSEKWDEWINVTSPRIKKFNSLGKSAISDYRHFALWSETHLRFSNDEIFTKEGTKLYAVPRKKVPLPFFAAKLINLFGNQRGFDEVLKRIQNTQKWAPIEVVVQLVSALSKMSKNLHKDFAREYIPELKDAVWENMLGGPEDRIKELTCKHIHQITEAMDSLLLRVYSPVEQNEMIETFTLDLYTLCLNSSKLETKIQAVEGLTRRFIENPSFVKSKYLFKHIIENDLLDKIYGSRGDALLVNKFLILLLQQSSTSAKEIKLIWDALRKGNDSVKVAAYSLLSVNMESFNRSTFDLLEDRVSFEIGQLNTNQLNELCGKPLSFAEKMLLLFGNYVASISSSVHSKNDGLLNATLQKIIIEDWKQNQEYDNIISDCLANINQRVMILPSIQMLERRMTDYYDDLVNKKPLKELLVENNMILILVKDFIDTIQELIQTNAYLFLNVSASRAPLPAQIRKRLEFIFNIIPTPQEMSQIKTGVTKEIMEVLIGTVREAFNLDWNIPTTEESEEGFLITLKSLIRAIMA